MDVEASNLQIQSNNDLPINIDDVGKVLADKGQPLAVRFRALFVLRNLKCDKSVKYISKCFSDNSALLKHELAYCLGQMQNKTAVPYLVEVLEDLNQEGIVRHEAGEALGALGDFKTIEVLTKYINDSKQEVAETCQLALKRFQWLQEKQKDESDESIYKSVDPAPPNKEYTSINNLSDILLNENFPLWDRYKAMFSLRNFAASTGNGVQAVEALTQGLKCEKSGALFRHEIAYVLGQIQSPNSIKGLSESLQNINESPMVRHECAEALGSIATPECKRLVQKYVIDKEKIVRESCEVALDMIEQSNNFQYAKINIK